MSRFKIGVISGYFNPIHAGHIDYINSAKEQCDKLWVIVNNDQQAVNKVGRSFIPQEDRVKIVNSIKGVDRVFLSFDEDETVCQTLNYVLLEVILDGSLYGETAFINSGDRQTGNSKEIEECNKVGVSTVYIPLPKVDSSTRIRSLLWEQ